ncbi:MAG: DHH family phosphoesterase [Nanoarchaeota archaeon]|nr:DHH family phosphoesterase [Nanoarchaeota archaeon]
MDFDGFKKHVRDAAEKFSQLDKNEVVRLISHLDADGIAASSLMIKLLNKENMKYSISIVTQLKKEVIDTLALEPYKYFIFTDLGSGQLSYLKEKLGDKKILIFDHHEPEAVESQNIIHVNPHMFGIDGSREISGAGVVYFFTKAVNQDMEKFAHIAVIGAIGDVQEDNGFSKLNDEILKDAVKHGNMKVIQGLRIFGAQTRPVHKVLEYCTTPYIPGVTGSESGAIQFLQQIGINPKRGTEWKKIVHLDQEEMQKLCTGIIMKRLGEKNPEEILGNVYILPNEEKESPTRDVKEFSTLLNACGRMNKASLGIGACLGDTKTKKRAIQSLLEYKKEIVNAIKWYEKNQNSKDVIKKDGYIIINARDKILPTIAGTLGSIISRSNDIKDGTYILSMADLLDGTIKASLRVAGLNQEVDLRATIKSITDRIEGCEAGGHMHAAGAMIPVEKEQEFIKIANEILRKISLEENVK